MNRIIGILLLIAVSLYGCGGDEVAPGSQDEGKSGARSSENATEQAQRPGKTGTAEPGERRTGAGERGQRPGAAADGADVSREERARQIQERMAQFKDRPVPVAVTTVERGRVDAFYSTTASLTAEEEASIVARTQGVVEAIFVEEGDFVDAETPLAQLDTDMLELEVARTRTNVESFERAYQRASQLRETRMISPEAYDQARYNLDREKATLALQLYQLEEATIRAPIDGVITRRLIKLGNTLAPNSAAFEIKRADTIEAILNVPEKELVKISRGQLARVSIDALNEREFEGVVKRVAPEVDPTSGTFRVTVALDNPDRVLKPGMFARVSVRYDSNDNTLLVAREAVVTQKDESAVFVVRGGIATRQIVRTGYEMDSQVELLDGVGEGEQVVITGQGGLRDGASVRVVPL
ncbi:MAG: efflux RND transporter periplasmic adaptor subunit [Proteobacteria bacterium]|nr:efflux RND transporter periplasmic adaptor subunit [Pseudomonadota bacterium]MDA1300109.1 efflux RND transporter periplasmic adaptor subunit [Pseudomonadota bacterium]